MLQHWLEKATFTTADINPPSPTAGGLLAPEQVNKFLQIAIEESVLLGEIQNHTSPSTKFEIPRISFANRIMKPGVEATRLVDGDRVKPTTGLVTLSTVLIKGEVPVSDEIFEDQIEKEGLADTLMTMIAQAVGRDVEEFVIKSDTARTGAEDAYLDLTDGVVKNFQTGLPAGQKVDASAYGSYDELFAKMLEALPARYRRNEAQLRYYVPVKHKDGYVRELAGRGTPLGDQATISKTNFGFRGIPVVQVPMMSGTSLINTASVDYGKFAFLTHPLNIYVGWHRKIKVEKWRDPREGVVSFLPSCRVDTDHADPELGVLASNVDITL